jgi:hypothetical protein
LKAEGNFTILAVPGVTYAISAGLKSNHLNVNVFGSICTFVHMFQFV